MNVLFDNCTAPLFATTLDGFISHYGHRAFHIKDVPGLPGGRRSADIDWIKHLQSAPETWIFISGDGRVLRNPAERAALRSAGLHGFILAPAYQKTSMNQVAATIVWKWPEIEGVTKLVAAPSMHEIPIQRISKLRALPL
ncbi:hypothetical protein [Mesorhizobium sp. CO1-1-8]|uniref:PIN-like domain-containing protein n=1 Tax=Mesorhizobium sp. CO1-1-8 TaxID=2876631 RepID=UPI001CD09529|nr:hypothetical protein [Mesorhizobium sp. CO1-1-8]MBZ9773039.1 hypothetical protein [Mesorhizobium sp. CO1-1-8]